MKKEIIISIIIAAFFIFGAVYLVQNRDKEESYPPLVESVFPEEETVIGNDEEIDNEVKEEPEETSGDSISQLVQCLADAGVVVYGMYTCPACAQFADSFGGYEVIDPIYVECTEEWERCNQEMKTTYVPEIQIKDSLFEGQRTPQGLAEATGCKI